MKKENITYFAPDYPFTRLLVTTDPIEIIGAYRRRIFGFYLNVAKKLMDTKDEAQAFSAGIMCFAAIDAIARTEMGIDESGPRVKQWLQDHISDFRNLDDTHMKRVYDEFRCGLMHEARIKNGGYFTYEIASVVDVSKDDIISINPEKLLKNVEIAFTEMLDNETKGQHSAENFRDLIIADFKIDLDFLEEQFECENPDCSGGQDVNTGEMCIYCDGEGIDPNHNYEKAMDSAEDAAEFSGGE